MENASKALIISGGILISILVMSIGVYLFVSYRESSSTIQQTMQASQLQEFNVNFTTFEGRSEITIQEIATLVNFVKQYNKEQDVEIKVWLNNDNLLDNDIIELIQDNLTNENEVKYFKCNVSINTDITYDNYGRVNSIKFTET